MIDYITVFFLLLSGGIIHAYFITVDADAEECLFERVEGPTKLGLTFEIVEGGFLDIDVIVKGPDGAIIYEGNKETAGKYSFSASTPGTYLYCFSNKMSTMTPKTVMFNMLVGEPAPAVGTQTADGQPADGEHSNKLDDMIKTLTSSLSSVKQEQEYMQVRDRIHRSINESTNSRVVLWSFFEAFILIAMTVGQVYYLKRFFEVRRVV